MILVVLKVLCNLQLDGVFHMGQGCMPLYHPPRPGQRRLTRNRAGDVVLQLKSPYHDGTTHIVMSPLQARGNFEQHER